MHGTESDLPHPDRVYTGLKRGHFSYRRAVNTGRSISMIVPNVGTAIGMRNVVGNHAEHQNFVFGTVRLNKGESAKITLYQDNGAARLLSLHHK